MDNHDFVTGIGLMPIFFQGCSIGAVKKMSGFAGKNG